MKSFLKKSFHWICYIAKFGCYFWMIAALVGSITKLTPKKYCFPNLHRKPGAWPNSTITNKTSRPQLVCDCSVPRGPRGIGEACGGAWDVFNISWGPGVRVGEGVSVFCCAAFHRGGSRTGVRRHTRTSSNPPVCLLATLPIRVAQLLYPPPACLPACPETRLVVTTCMSVCDYSSFLPRLECLLQSAQTKNANYKVCGLFPKPSKI